MHAELSFYIHLHALGSTAAAGWSRQREDAAAQCDSLCSAASTVSSLSMFLCDGRHSSVSPHASRRVFLMGVRPARRQAQRPGIQGGSAAQPPLRQGGADGQGQLAACSAGLSRRRGDSFDGRLNSLQSRAGQQRSHPYGKAVLAARASSQPAVQGSRVGVATALVAGSTACNPGRVSSAATLTARQFWRLNSTDCSPKE